MRAAKAWPAGLVALTLGALALRLVGLKTGLPYVYNADENNHFVPRAIGMFGHSLNPDYFVNPPAYTYLVHGLYLVRWGTDPASIGAAFAANPTTAFVIARAAAAVLGAAAVTFTALAGARLFGDRRVGILAGALLAVAFLAVHYSHFALNDAPTLAPAALCLVGVAGIYRHGRRRDFALAGIALGLAIATKYTGGILVVAVVAAAVAGGRWRGLLLAGVLTVAAFLVADPYALLDAGAFHQGLTTQTSTASEEGGKLGLQHISGWRYYASAGTWAFGWLPSLAALGGAIGLALRDRRLALILLPAPILLYLYLGHQTRFFARWLLPVYPVLALLAAYAAVEATRRIRFGWIVAGVVLCAQGLVFTIHNDVVLARTDTRQLARDWLVAHVPAGTKIVVEPVFPDQWAMDVGHYNPATRSGYRWNKWPTSRVRLNPDGTPVRGPGALVKLEDYEKTLQPALVDRYRTLGYCWVVTGSTQYGRAYADPKAVPRALPYYAHLKATADLAYKIAPYKAGAQGVPFSFDYSFNYYPLQYSRPGPEVDVYRLRNCT
jgi:dolichyl-phosphate-mannose-protein mannosyltransferase